MSGSLAAKSSDVEADKGRVTQTKVQRYRTGRAPTWSDSVEAGDQALDASNKERTRTEGVAAPVIVRKADDPRLRRLAQSQHQEEDREEALQRRREIRAAEVVRRGRSGESSEGEEAADEEEGHDGTRHGSDRQADQEGEEEEADTKPAAPLRGRMQVPVSEDDDEALRKRQAVRERLLQQQREQEAAAAAAAEEDEEEEEESEYETDSEDEGAGRRLLKPVFVPKLARETIAERDALEREEEQFVEKEKARLLERKKETQQIVRETIALEATTARDAAQGPLQVEDVDTDDEKDPAEAYEAWKQRELVRIKRDREEKEKIEKEIVERDRLRNMTEEERAAWDRANPKDQVDGEKAKLRFMQKYWHKGAYFQDNADDERSSAGGYDIYQRDYSGPTGEDKFDRAALPKVMQVKNFGRAGRTKYTHLVDQDTTYTAAVSDDPMIQGLKDQARKREAIGSRPEDFAKPKKFRL